MLKKLRIKFISLIMVIVAMILTAAFSVICYMDWQQNVTESDIALEAAIMRAAHAQDGEPPTDGDPLSEGDPSLQDDQASDRSQYGSRKKGDGAPRFEDGNRYAVDDKGDVVLEDRSDSIRGIYPATRSGRFNNEPVPNIFTAVHKLEGDEWVLLFDSSTALAIAPEFSNEWAVSEMGLHEGTGMFGDRDLYYMQQTLPEGTFLAMVYAGPLEQWKGLALRLGLLGLAVLVVFFFISLAFSKWALGPVKRAWAQQRRFVADASHDLKTPLTVILANTSILLDREDDTIESQRRWIESTRTEAEDMQGLVEDLLLLANEDEAESDRGISKKADEDAPVTDLSRLVGKELLQFESIAFERDIAIGSEIAEGLLVRGSDQDLRRIAQTLLENAFKYVDDGGTVSVSLSADTAKRIASLRVSNSGNAIPKDDQAHIFDRFYRSDKARTSNEGHGLGLAIAKTLVEKLGGRIAVSSDEESGTTFVVGLPLE